jgi:predicted RecA/RadA family phage recombinase
MAKNFIAEGDVLLWTNSTGAAVVSGQVVKVGQILGVAAVDIANGASGSVMTCGVFELPKKSSAVITQGMALLWDVSAGNFDVGSATPATGDVSDAAFAYEAAGNGATTVKVHLDERIGTVA